MAHQLFEYFITPRGIHNFCIHTKRFTESCEFFELVYLCSYNLVITI